MAASPITTLIFDVDDTLYDVGNGFTVHRNNSAPRMMVEKYKFPSEEAAQKVKAEYFSKYHSTAKALKVAQDEGKFPEDAPEVKTEDIATFWAEKLDYTMLGPPKTALHDELSKCNCTLVAFSNGPRKYVKRALETMGLFDLFGEERLYAVDDVMPHCKPEKEAFEKILKNIGNPKPETCVMVEDSMKNIRGAKALGMKTVLIRGSSENGRILKDDKPNSEDPAVDCSMASIEEFFTMLPGLLDTNPVFDPVVADK
ncbi:unnamed protein product [Cylindrotheca closterium]|uniref:Pyrimidine 5'-nucleotidase n=1 Tax=Cylindrotheca closterium TaxID=2856 RepID=A0AAD2CDR7_9STRA|nr:unnamed protein product [Cylindrotheca closterium]